MKTDSQYSKGRTCKYCDEQIKNFNASGMCGKHYRETTFGTGKVAPRYEDAGMTTRYEGESS